MDRSVDSHSPGHDLRPAWPAGPRRQRIQSRHPHQGQYARRAGRSREVFEAALRAQAQQRLGRWVSLAFKPSCPVVPRVSNGMFSRYSTDTNAVYNALDIPSMVTKMETLG